MRQPKPWWRADRQCWYVEVEGRQRKLDPDERIAWKKYHELMAGREHLGEDPTVLQVFRAFRAWSKRNHRPETQEFYYGYQKSFLRSVGKRLRVSQLKPLHLTNWVDGHWPAQDVIKRGKVVQERASSSTRHGAMRAVTRALNWAEEKTAMGKS
jgi:hypothetical protein